MKEKKFAEEALARVLLGESWEDVVDDISHQIGKDDNSNCLDLTCLNYIDVKRNGELIQSFYRTEFFQNPPTKEVAATREIFDLLGIELIPREDFQSSPSVTIKVSKPTRLIQTEEGFWSKWIILYRIPCGTIKECGNFWDRGADIIIDIPNLTR